MTNPVPNIEQVMGMVAGVMYAANSVQYAASESEETYFIAGARLTVEVDRLRFAVTGIIHERDDWKIRALRAESERDTLLNAGLEGSR